ncbi:MAG: potassium channel family protein [Acidiferrobacterales bacterium]
MKRISEENNFAYLTVALVILLFVGAVTDHFPSGLTDTLIESAAVATLVVGVWGFRAERLWRRTGLSLVVAILVIVAFDFIVDLAGLHYLELVIMFAFFVLTAWLAARQVLFTGSVDVNKVVGAVCIFLLLGMIWATLYLMVAQAAPGSFNGLDSVKWHENFPHLAYFSFVSLTTLGYGDITPALPVPRFLAYLEAVTGQLYIAIVIASLVGARISVQKSSR